MFTSNKSFISTSHSKAAVAFHIRLSVYIHVDMDQVFQANYYKFNRGITHRLGLISSFIWRFLLMATLHIFNNSGTQDGPRVSTYLNKLCKGITMCQTDVFTCGVLRPTMVMLTSWRFLENPQPLMVNSFSRIPSNHTNSHHLQNCDYLIGFWFSVCFKLNAWNH